MLTRGFQDGGGGLHLELDKHNILEASGNASSDRTAANEPPREFLCPITMDNGTDDRPCASRRRAHLLKTSAIARWLQASRISPATGASLRNTRLNHANYTLRKLIQDHPTRVAEASRTAHMNAQALAEAVEHEACRAHTRARH